MVVGNMGTANKMDYTIMGNAVNLASRLEGVNKQYNTRGILLSEYTRALIGDSFVIRPLSRVRVVGINTPLRLFELLDTKEEASSEVLSAVEEWNKAMELYEAGNFKEAEKSFAALCAKDSTDQVSELYRKRSSAYSNEPPAEGWDAVDNLTEK
jgi:adenylate cyclase